MFARGNARMRIFLDEADFRLYEDLLRRVIRGRRWRCLRYCLMPNHVHFVLETTEPNLGEGMQRLQSLYAQIFNLTNARSGHLFQGRFGAVRIRDERQLAATIEYVINNPVEAGLVSPPDEWPWAGVTPGDRATVLAPLGDGGTVPLSLGDGGTVPLSLSGGLPGLG